MTIQLIRRPHPSGKGFCPDGPLTPLPKGKHGTRGWLVWSQDLAWLMALRDAIPARHGLPVPSPDQRQAWRMDTRGWFQHGRPAKVNTSRPGRMRWFDEPYFVNHLGIWRESSQGNSEPRPDERFLPPTVEALATWVLGLKAHGIESLGPHGVAEGRCAICRRKLSDSASKVRGIGPECLSFFDVSEHSK